MKGISQFDNRVKEYKAEVRQIIEICAKLNAFSRQNAVVIVSSTGGELLKCLENHRQTYAMLSNTSNEANYLTEIKSQYEKELSKAVVRRYTVEDVPKLIQQLCKLPMKGPEIKQALDEEKKARLKPNTHRRHRRD